MASSNNSIMVARMLRELCERLGYCSALREIARVEALVQKGAPAIADVVLEVEGLNPESAKQQRREVLAVVEKYLSRGASAV
jgi:hypothetical protein